MPTGDPEIHCPGCRCRRDMWVIPMNPQQPFKCPVCNGAGKVSRPPWVAGDVEIYSASNPMELFDCSACDGKGVIWK